MESLEGNVLSAIDMYGLGMLCTDGERVQQPKVSTLD